MSQTPFDRSGEAKALIDFLRQHGFAGLDKEDAECILQALELLAAQAEKSNESK